MYAGTLKHLGFLLRATLPAIDIEDSRFEVSLTNKVTTITSTIPNMPQFQLVNYTHNLELNAVLSKVIEYHMLSEHHAGIIHQRAINGDWTAYYIMLKAISGLILEVDDPDNLRGTSMVAIHLRIARDTNPSVIFASKKGCNSIW